jgi:hypothetical protein
MKLQPCCITPDAPGLPATVSKTAPAPRLAPTLTVATEPAVALHETIDRRSLRIRPGPTYLRHVALLI